MKSGSQLYEDVMGKLRFAPNVNEQHITILVTDGVVNLAGTVSSYIAKRNAESAVRNISGVKAVANELVVKWLDKVAYTDLDIAKAATNALDWTVEVPLDAVKVVVESGKLKLTGKVDAWYQRRAAERAVRGLRGVKEIENHISIQVRVDETDIKKEITKEFHRNAQIDAEQVKVSVSKGEVTLTGKVRSYAELKEASKAAWSMPGINSVKNQLVIG